MTLKLYSYWRSSCSYRVRIALAWKELAYEYVPVHLLKGGGEQHSESHRSRNPLGQVPVLEVLEGGKTEWIGQSMAICLYLEAKHPHRPLVPRDALAQARVIELAEMINSGIQPLQNLSVMKTMKALGRDPNEWSKQVIERGLAALEARLTHTAGRSAVGDTVTLADAFVVPQLYNARRFGVDLAPFPTLRRVETACIDLPAFRAAHPDAQPDCEPVSA